MSSITAILFKAKTHSLVVEVDLTHGTLTRAETFKCAFFRKVLLIRFFLLILVF